MILLPSTRMWHEVQSFAGQYEIPGAVTDQRRLPLSKSIGQKVQMTNVLKPDSTEMPT